MLFGSCSGLVAPPVADPETPPAPAPLVCAPGVPAAAAPLLSTTGASVVGVVEQPTRAVAISATNNRLRMASPAWMSGAHDPVRKGRESTGSRPRKRSPGGLTHVGRRCDEPLFHATVAGDRGQCTTPSR